MLEKTAHCATTHLADANPLVGRQVKINRNGFHGICARGHIDSPALAQSRSGFRQARKHGVIATDTVGVVNREWNCNLGIVVALVEIW